LKNNSLQVLPGELFGMPQNKAKQWIQTLLPVVQTALKTLGDTPARSLEQLAQRLGGQTLPATSALRAEASAGNTTQEKQARADPPLFAMMGPNDVSSAAIRSG